MKSLGIDPGTMSFDFCLVDQFGAVLEEISIPSREIMERPALLVDVLMASPADIIVGPSGYGVPTCLLRDADERTLGRLLPADEGETPVNEGIRSGLRLLRDQGAPVVFTPGVIDLVSVPTRRKFNRFDMGTADKVAVAFLALANRLKRSQRGPETETFALLEIGAGFTAALAIVDGRIVDGIGGSMSFGGLNSSGLIDAELAYRRGVTPYQDLYRYGVAELDTAPLAEWAPCGEAGRELVERALKTVFSLFPIVGSGRQVVVSGRLAEQTWVGEAVLLALADHVAAELIRREAKGAKAAAEGAARLGLALLGGSEAAVAVHMGIVGADRIPIL
jgi:predicted butyrate kinase (DUF1464 family)